MTSPLPLPLTTESSSHQRASISVLDQVLLYGLTGLLLFGPLAFGAVESWSIWIMEVGASLFFVLWAARRVMAGEWKITGNPLFLPMLFFVGLILVQLTTGRTAYRNVTFSTALLYCMYGMVCFLAVQSLRKTSQIKSLAWVFSAYGFTVALFALMQSIASNGKLYWLRTPQSGGWIYGPYVNHNHYAGLMEMLTPIPLVISVAREVRGPRKVLAALAAAVMASTIFLSGSRGGMVAFAVQMALLATFLVKQRKSWKTTLTFSTFLIVALGLLAWLGGGELADRMASIPTVAKTELSGATRLNMDRDALKIFAQKPVLGWGLGVFDEIHPQFSSFSSNIPVGMAHNDYLQLLDEMGGLGFAIVLWFLLILYRSALKKLQRGQLDVNAAVTLASMLSVSGILVHSFADFNLQIPANAALFYVLCVVAVMEPGFEVHRRIRRNRHHSVEELPGDPLIPATASTG